MRIFKKIKRFITVSGKTTNYEDMTDAQKAQFDKTFVEFDKTMQQFDNTINAADKLFKSCR